MKKIIKSAAISLCLALAVSAVCGCDSTFQNVSADQSAEINAEQNAKPNEEQIAEQETEPKTEQEEEKNIEQDVDLSADKNTEDNAYKAAYLDKINELKSEGLADQFALVNIDGDDIPELIASDSEGSFDHENAFIFTIDNDSAVQLAGVITGVDGGSLDYAEGANLIHISGAAAGTRDVFSKINDGNLEEVFRAEATSMDEDAEYSINKSKNTITKVFFTSGSIILKNTVNSPAPSSVAAST